MNQKFLDLIIAICSLCFAIISYIYKDGQIGFILTIIGLSLFLIFTIIFF